METPLSGEKPSQVKVRRPRNRRPPRQFVAGNEAPCVESNQLSSDPASDEATTSTEQPGSGTTVYRASIEEEKSLSQLELGKAKSPLNNVLSDASVRNEASTTGEEICGADECPVEKLIRQTVESLSHVERERSDVRRLKRAGLASHSERREMIRQ